MPFVQAFNLFVAVPRQPDLNFILTIASKVVGKRCAPTSTQGKSLDMLLLSEVRPNPEGVAPGRTARRAHRQPADFLRG